MIKAHSGNPESNEKWDTGMAKDCLLEEIEPISVKGTEWETSGPLSSSS